MFLDIFISRVVLYDKGASVVRVDPVMFVHSEILTKVLRTTVRFDALECSNLALVNY
jgi:hypothetical protein